ncbi:DeoR/GlpR family DNA-binding transcription regulator [Allosalinactinospora lopnorensis]|uniref:DeoR/GlpR family DNA-binding transcription regulator n=1 Tax=Allosalinactinospora lopnorensis TaxID=1352348 RepID=UPI000623E002|nr:DeoR/GlpR family DNA-binding transcription regulator [Allosalinactinospora lopnorensis]
MRSHQRLLDAVLDGVQRVEDLAEALGVSPSTVRRGLGDLESAGKIVRTHGGAVPAGLAGELSWTQKSRQHAPAKRRIADRAARMVEEGACVLLDAGSTTTFVAELLAERTGLTVVTNGTGPLWALHDATGVELIVAGGRLRHRRGSMVGDHTRAVLDRLTADIAFIGADGLRPGKGVNCSSADLAAVKEAHFRNTRHAVVVADSSKIGAAPYPHWAVAPGPYTVITDDAITEDGLQSLSDDPHCTPLVVPLGTSPPPPH